jgi:copper homeostasis protein CutC
LTGRLLACAPDLKATFHHAFDQSRDQLKGIAELKRLPQVDRLLTAGKGAHSRQMDNFAAYEEAAAPEIRVLAGGGLDAARIRAIYRATSIREFHVGRAARVPATIDGEVSAERVRMIIAQLN